jgi:hypothetical protein
LFDVFEFEVQISNLNLHLNFSVRKNVQLCIVLYRRLLVLRTHEFLSVEFVSLHNCAVVYHSVLKANCAADSQVLIGCRAAYRGADRAAWALRDEHTRRNHAGVRRLPLWAPPEP